MRPIAVPPPTNLGAVLPGYDFADAFALDVAGADLTALSAAERVFLDMPGWLDGLLAVRNCAVRPFRLKSTAEARASTRNRIGFFPVISSAADRVVMGLDDRHLDFRVVVDVAEIAVGRQCVTVTTVIKRHNLLGRAYLATVTPFHKMIVPAMLARVAA